MSKMMVIARNEFRTRVRTKWFILTTLLGPVALIGLFVVVAIVGINSVESEEQDVVVIDESGLLFPHLLHDQIRFREATSHPDELRERVLEGDYDGYLVVPEDVATGGTVVWYSASGGGSLMNGELRGAVRSAVRALRVEQQDIDPAAYSAIMANIPMDSVQLTQSGEERGNVVAYAVIGGIMGFLLYMAMLIYGSVVMQGVMQEKQNRVVEIIVSSMRPTELLMGKVLGIGAMGLLQMTFWAMLIAAGSMLSGLVVGLFVDPASLQLPSTATNQEVLAAMNFSIPVIEPLVYVVFVVYFLGGYLLYATLFAAIGSSVEQQQDAQGIMLPVMLPIILSIAFMQSVIENPDSTLAVVLSLIPFTSPIPMVVRVAMIDVPLWELAASLLLMGLFIQGAVWVAGRIYRVGILSYGKKPSLLDLARWIRQA
ncbi:MAG: ABC transporter permease [Bacteroidetes bacterium CG12_big_fil_rev_8_21_14_0_65_60_17]|nr:MAG: ABC transporter permease [Bacteroidetes bacterium CG12_big_fil_rev_8_21_14_0_65_60_17]